MPTGHFREERLAHGSTVLFAGAPPHPIVVRDPNGVPVVEAEWTDDGKLSEARVRIPPARREAWLDVRPEDLDHPVFGEAFRIGMLDAQNVEHLLTSGGAIDWSKPEVIPPLERPSSLPAGGGTAILNWVAMLLGWAKVSTVRYRGPYPTSQLFDALLESFTLESPRDVGEARSTFIEKAEEAAMSGWPVEPRVQLAPAPFERVFDATNDVVVQLHGEPGAAAIERVFVGAEAFEGARAGTVPTTSRLVRASDDGQWASVRVELGGEPWRFVATVDVRGRVLWRTDADCRIAPAVAGNPAFSERWLWVVTGMIARRAPRALAPAIVKTLTDGVVVRWGDAGDAVCAPVDDVGPVELAAMVHRGHAPVLNVHSAVPARFALGLGGNEMHPRKNLARAKALLAEVTRGIEPLVSAIAQARLAAEGLEAFPPPEDDPFVDLDAETATLLLDLSGKKDLPSVSGDVGPPRTDSGRGVVLD